MGSKLARISGSKLARIGTELQTSNRELTWREFYTAVAQVAKDVNADYWSCNKHKMLSAHPKREGLGIATITKTQHWSATIGSVSVNRDSARECVLMLIANLVAEKHIK